MKISYSTWKTCWLFTDEAYIAMATGLRENPSPPHIWVDQEVSSSIPKLVLEPPDELVSERRAQISRRIFMLAEKQYARVEFFFF